MNEDIFEEVNEVVDESERQLETVKTESGNEKKNKGSYEYG